MEGDPLARAERPADGANGVFENAAEVQELLATRLEREEVAIRDGAGAQKVSARSLRPLVRLLCGSLSGVSPQVPYVESWRVIEKAQRIFGFNGWSSRIVDITQDFEKENTSSGRWTTGYS